MGILATGMYKEIGKKGNGQTGTEEDKATNGGSCGIFADIVSRLQVKSNYVSAGFGLSGTKSNNIVKDHSFLHAFLFHRNIKISLHKAQENNYIYPVQLRLYALFLSVLLFM